MKASWWRDFSCAFDFQRSYFEWRRVAVRRVDSLECEEPSGTGASGGLVLCCCVMHR